ncbi:MAG: hypothetical protein MdMp024_1638 [Bacteroidales bacterium]
MKLWRTYLLLILLSASCISEEIDIPNERETDGKQEVAVRIKIPAGAVTKALSPEDEYRIDNLRIFVFRDGETDNTADDIYLYDIFVSGSDLQDTGEPNVKSAIVVLKSLPEAQYLLLVANMPPSLTLSLTKEVSTRRHLIEQLTFSGEPWRTPSPSPPAFFPMWGQKEEPVVVNATHRPSAPVEITLIRAMAQIEVGVDIDGEDNPALGFGSVFKIDSIYVCNASDSGYIAPHPDYLNAVEIGKPHPLPYKIEQAGYAFPEGRRLSHTIYVPESDTLLMQGGTVVNEPAFLVIRAHYYDSPAPYYYRIDFVNALQGVYEPLLRNHYYLINITGVRTEGYGSLQEARESPVSALNFSLILDDADAEINRIVYTGDYMLGFSANAIQVDWEAGSAGQPVTIPVKTTYPGGWKAELLPGSASAFALTTASGVAGAVTTVGLQAGRNLTGAPRMAQLRLTAGAISEVITVTQSAGANSYMVETGGSVRIPVTSADRDGVKRSAAAVTIDLMAVNGNVAASVSGDFINDKYFTVTANGEGNVLVLLKDNNGDVLWSWHVWALPAGVDFEQPAYQRAWQGYVFMDRNLGSSGTASAGLYYQWGRKDPFPSGFQLTSGYGIEEVAVSDNLASAVEHPTVFYTSQQYPYDWKGTQQHNNLWNTTEGKKGIYDPCPFGWRVIADNGASLSIWDGFINGSNGLFFPHSGRLDGTDSIPADANNGFIWTASPQGTGAYAITPGAISRRAVNRFHACPVRCVRDIDK